MITGTGLIETLGVGQILMVLITFLKVLFEKLVSPDDPMHDITIQVMALVLGAIGWILYSWTTQNMTGPLFWQEAGQGALSGLSAIGGYHGATAVVQAVTAKPVVVTTQDIPIALNISHTVTSTQPAQVVTKATSQLPEPNPGAVRAIPSEA